MKAFILGCLCLALLGCSRDVTWGPGVVAPREPIQEPTGRSPWEREGFSFEPLADFEVEARVLSVKRYTDETGDLSPLDLALGWGRMSDEAVLDRLKIRQSGRWYHYVWEDQAPIPAGEIVRSSANMHMIPATPEVLDALKEVGKGEVVVLKGVLVSVRGPGGFRLKSSLSRKDTGDGACEVLWVERVERPLAP